MAKLTDEVRALLSGPNYAHLATLMRDGSPQSVAVWVGLEGDRILVATGEGSQKARNTRRDGRVALSITDRDNPYKVAHIRGRVVEVRPDEENAVMDPLSVKYTGRPFPTRGPGRIALVIEPEHVSYRALPFEHQPG